MLLIDEVDALGRRHAHLHAALHRSGFTTCQCAKAGPRNRFFAEDLITRRVLTSKLAQRRCGVRPKGHGRGAGSWRLRASNSWIRWWAAVTGWLALERIKSMDPGPSPVESEERGRLASPTIEAP